MNNHTSFIDASKWSMLTEICVKFITPFSFLVLTKILSPSDFSIVAVATTILSFTYIISDLGVSKIIIQSSVDRERQDLIQNAGFYLNVLIGTLIFLLLFLFSKNIANSFNQPNSNLVICTISLQVLAYSFSSVQTAIFKKNLLFKKLFIIRVVTTFIPILVSVPIAIIYKSYWSIIIGNVISSFVSCVMLWYLSDWKPNFKLSNLHGIKVVFLKSFWNTLEQLIIMIPVFLDTYLISTHMEASDLGMYNVSRTLFTSCASLSLGAILPVFFSSLSSKSSDKILFKNLLLKGQKSIFFLASIMAIFGFLLSNLIETIFFATTWRGISKVISIIFLILGLEYFNSPLIEGFRSKGRFKLLAINSLISVLITIPILFYLSNFGIFPYIVGRCLSLYIGYITIAFLSRDILDVKYITFIRMNYLTILYVLTVIILSAVSNFKFQNYILFVLFIVLQYFQEKNNIHFMIKKLIKRK